MRYIPLILASALFALTVNAQNSEVAYGRCNRTLGLNNVRNLPDSQLKLIGDRISANGLPDKATAKQLLQTNCARANSMRHQSGDQSRISTANYNASDTIFWETWSGWDQMTMPWIPTTPNKWSTKSGIADLTPYIADNSCPTWTVYEGDGYYVPYATDGAQMLLCMFGAEVLGADGSTILTPAPQQDEWIVSPTINAIEGSNYLSFDICFSPWNTHYFIEDNDTLFDTSRIAYDVEVMITTNTRSASYDASNYDVVFRLSEEVDRLIAATDMNDDAAVGQLLYMMWKHIRIPLADYDGNNIRIALRYTGTKGGSVLVDAIRVSDLLPVAMYDIPQGAFYWGFSNEMYSMTNDQVPYKFAFIPAYTPSIWRNLSNQDAQDYIWTYTDGEGNAQSTDIDLTMPAQTPSNLVEMPKLLANAGRRADEAALGYFRAGGATQINYDNGMTVTYNVGNYDLMHSWWTAEIGNAGSGMYAFGSNSGSFWAQASNYRFNNVDGVGNFFEKPLSPYVFNEVSLPLGDYLNLGATLACTIYKVIDGFISDEVIAQSVFNPNDTNPRGAATLVPNTAGMYCLQFFFDTPLVIDDAIFIVIDGFDNSNMISIAPIAQALNHDNGLGYAFVKLGTQNGGYQYVEVAGALASVDGGSNMEVSMCIGLNAIYPYLVCQDGEAFCANNNGDSKEFAIDTYWSPEEWTITCDNVWFTAEPIMDATSQKASLRITVDELPDDVEGRNGTVTINALGCEETILVLQGSDADGIIIVPENSTEDVLFTLSGQPIDAENAHGGVFIAKKNGKFIKIVR